MTAKNTTDEIDTGITTNNTRIKTSDWEVEGHADDGEHAMVWLFRSVSDELIETLVLVCEAGSCKEHGPLDVFDVDPETSISEFAREHVTAYPEESIRIAREAFKNE